MMEADRELDALVATKVMGWHRSWERWLDDSGAVAAVDGEDRHFQTWEPRIDITAAMLVVEKMREQGWVWHISIGPTTTVAIERAGVRHYDLDGKLVGPGSR